MVVSGVKLNRLAVAGAIATVAALAVQIPKALSQNALITVDGSSTVFPITEAAAEEFMADNRGIQITVGVSGTGGGFKKFCADETDISNASRPIKNEEKEACAAKGVEYLEVPLGYDALTVVVNRDNTWAQNMTTAQLKKLWEPAAEENILRWDQINSDWPNRRVRLYGPGTDSGTFDYFTEVINGKAQASRSDYTASEDDNILVLGVERDRHALGYFGMNYYLEHQDRLRAVTVNGVAPTPENVLNGTYKPLSRPLYMYVKKSSLSRPEVRSFVQYYLNNATELVTETDYVPLPPEKYTETLSKL